MKHVNGLSGYRSTPGHAVSFIRLDVHTFYKKQVSCFMTAADALHTQKAILRTNAQKQRHLAAIDYPDAASQIADFADVVMTRFKPSIVAGFWPIHSELSPLYLMKALAQKGCQLCLPVTGNAGTALIFRAFITETDLVDGPFKTRQPTSAAPIQCPDIILTPLLAFDRNGGRLGYGGGYYDRTFAAFTKNGKAPISVGIAYDEQEVEQVPLGPFDHRLTAILTNTSLRLA